MKYGLIGVIVIIIGLFYFMSQSNKADAERLKQAEIAHQQKLESEKAAGLNKEYGGVNFSDASIFDPEVGKIGFVPAEFLLKPILNEKFLADPLLSLVLPNWNG